MIQQRDRRPSDALRVQMWDRHQSASALTKHLSQHDQRDIPRIYECPCDLHKGRNEAGESAARLVQMERVLVRRLLRRGPISGRFPRG